MAWAAPFPKAITAITTFIAIATILTGLVFVAIVVRFVHHRDLRAVVIEKTECRSSYLVRT